MIKLTRKQEAVYSGLMFKLLEKPLKEFSMAVDALEAFTSGTPLIKTKRRMDIVMSMFLKEAFALYVAHCLDGKPATAEDYRIMVDNIADELKDFFNDPEMTASYVENSRDQAIRD